MNRIKEGFVPLDHREFRLSFRAPRDITHPDIAAASSQIARGDRQLFEIAKKLESPNRRVWFFVTFPSESSGSSSGKNVVKVDILIATPYGAMILRVLDWTGPCNTKPGEKWQETKASGGKVEHNNQLIELDTVTQWARIYLEKNKCCPATISSYVVFSSPHCKPNFTSDPRIIVGMKAASELVSGNGANGELGDSSSMLQKGQTLVKGLYDIWRNGTIDKSASNNSLWERFQACIDSTPQFDLIYLRKTQCFLFGKMEKMDSALFPNEAAAQQSLQKFCERKSGLRYRFQHAAEGILSAPVALVTGGLGLDPTCRITRVDYPNFQRPANVQDHVDVPPATRILFRPYGCEGIVLAEVNDIDYLELARVPRSLATTEDGVDTGLVDQLGQFLSGMVSKSIQTGMKSMLPYPLSAMVSLATQSQ